MMIPISRLERNIAAYVAEDMAPKMPKLEGVTLCAFAPFYIRSKMPLVLRYVGGTELCDGENIDVDRAVQEFRASAQGKWPFEIMGFTFYENDLDRLHNYLQR